MWWGTGEPRAVAVAAPHALRLSWLPGCGGKLVQWKGGRAAAERSEASPSAQGALLPEGCRLRRVRGDAQGHLCLWPLPWHLSSQGAPREAYGVFTSPPLPAQLPHLPAQGYQLLVARAAVFPVCATRLVRALPWPHPCPHPQLAPFLGGFKGASPVSPRVPLSCHPADMEYPCVGTR